MTVHLVDETWSVNVEDTGSGPGRPPCRLESLTYSSAHGSVVVRRRYRGAGLDLAPWVLEVELDGQQRYGFWSDETAASAAALEILGLLAEAANGEERAAGALRAAGAVLEADAFASDRSS